MLEFSHKPVMLEECMQGLALKDGGVWFDGTVGGGGHSYEILKRTAPNGRLIATDLDDEAIAAATIRILKAFLRRQALTKSTGQFSILEYRPTKLTTKTAAFPIEWRTHRWICAWTKPRRSRRK